MTKNWIVFGIVLALGFTVKADQQTPRHPVINTGRLIEVFYEAVDKGQLKVFKMQLNRNMIKPVEITYSYDLEGYQNKVLIVSKLTRPVFDPYSRDFHIESVTARLDRQGNIVEVWYDLIPVN